jgi:hypothetical protein
MPSAALTELTLGKLRIAKFRLDWIFVKSDLDDPRDQKGSYALAPHFARTLSNLNNGPTEPLADHSPITVDLPFQETAGPCCRKRFSARLAALPGVAQPG